MNTEERDPAVRAAESIGLTPPDRAGVAVSGGPDSLAALVLVARACARRGVPVTVLHVEHGLRPGRAAEEREVVRTAAASVGARLFVRAVDVRAVRTREGGSAEFVARILRHRALDEMASEIGLTHVVLAHHQDDQVETILLSILRGAWPAALCGMPASRPMPSGCCLIRPFLTVPRDALRTHATGLAVVDDEMNRDRRHRRVAVRLDLHPALLAAEPGLDRAVLRIAEGARVLDAPALENARRALESATREEGAAVLSAVSLRNAGRFGRARLVRALCDSEPWLGPPRGSVLDALERACQPGAAVDLEVRRGLRLVARSETVSIFLAADPGFMPRTLTWTGAVLTFPAGVGRTIEVRAGAAEQPCPAGRARQVELSIPVGASIEVRPRRAHDRFPLERGGSKLVADELADRKIPKTWRGRIPLVIVDGRLRWMPGVRVIGPRDTAPNAVVSLGGPMPWSEGG